MIGYCLINKKCLIEGTKKDQYLKKISNFKILVCTVYDDISTRRKMTFCELLGSKLIEELLVCVLWFTLVLKVFFEKKDYFLDKEDWKYDATYCNFIKDDIWTTWVTVCSGISTFVVHSEYENAQNQLTAKLPCLCEICIPTTCVIISIHWTAVTLSARAKPLWASELF